MKSSTSNFCPDWASAPGDTVIDILEDRGLKLADLGAILGRDPKDIDALLSGDVRITKATAAKLADALGSSVEFWLARDAQYCSDTRRLKEERAAWLANLPVRDMVQFGWLQPTKDREQMAKECLEFFGVSSIFAWRETCRSLESKFSFRTSPTFEAKSAATLAWLRQGELEGDAVDCMPWSAERFQASLRDVRALTRDKDPASFIPKLKACCARGGVAVAIVRSPKGCPASGATRFVSPQKAILQLSFRYLTDDQFWFTFFHEAGHLLLHGRKRLFWEGEERPDSDEEEEANAFAAAALVPIERQSDMLALPANPRRIIRFAVQIGVSPGIVVGQMQHCGRLRMNQLNSLKRRYAWSEASTINRGISRTD